MGPEQVGGIRRKIMFVKAFFAAKQKSHFFFPGSTKSIIIPSEKSLAVSYKTKCTILQIVLWRIKSCNHDILEWPLLLGLDQKLKFQHRHTGSRVDAHSHTVGLLRACAHSHIVGLLRTCFNPLLPS